MLRLATSYRAGTAPDGYCSYVVVLEWLVTVTSPEASFSASRINLQITVSYESGCALSTIGYCIYIYIMSRVWKRYQIIQRRSGELGASSIAHMWCGSTEGTTSPLSVSSSPSSLCWELPCLALIILLLLPLVLVPPLCSL